MACDKIEKKLPLYLQGSLPEKECRSIAAHLAGCDCCRGRLEELQQVWRLLGGLAGPGPAASSYPRVLARIDSREQRSGFLRSWLEQLMPSFAGTAAAVMILAFVSGALLSSQYYPDGTAPEQAESVEPAYSEMLSESGPESLFTIYFKQNGEENSL